MEFVLYEVKDQIAVITINREKALNALNSQVLDELNETLDGVDIDSIRCLILNIQTSYIQVTTILLDTAGIIAVM